MQFLRSFDDDTETPFNVTLNSLKSERSNLLTIVVFLSSKEEPSYANSFRLQKVESCVLCMFRRHLD